MDRVAVYPVSNNSGPQLPASKTSDHEHVGHLLTTQRLLTTCKWRHDYMPPDGSLLQLTKLVLGYAP